ncbi:MAG: two-component regulator propeller domain-containing protein [Acidobacteriota bacterium]
MGIAGGRSRRFIGHGREAARRWALLGAVLCLALGAGQPSAALDPGKAITQYGHVVWTVEEGLPASSVLCVQQTADGYLWIGTMGGLGRFDGVRFATRDPVTGVEYPSTGILAMLRDHEGGLWVAPQVGSLLHYEDGRFSRARGPELRADEHVTALAEGGPDLLWIGTSKGRLLSLRDGSVTGDAEPTGLSDVPIRAITTDASGVVWAATEGGGLLRVHGRSVTVLTGADGLPSSFLSCLWAARDGSLWVGTYGAGLVRLSGGKATVYTARDGLSSDFILCIREDRQGNLWIGTYGGGLDRFAPGRSSRFTTQEGLSNDIVACLLEDAEGSLWVGTFTALEQMRDTSVTNYSSQEGLPGDLAWCTLEDRNGGVWVGTSHGLALFRDGRFGVFRKRDGLGDDLVWSLYQDPDGTLWIGTRGGLTRYREGRFTTFTTRDGLSNNRVLAITRDHRGALWVGTDGGGLNRLLDGRFTAYTTRDGLANNTVIGLLEDHGGRLWIATRGRTSILEGGRLKSMDINGLCFLEERPGVLWIGTYWNGLTRFEGGKFRTCTRRQGLADDVIYRVLQDRKGNFWMGSSRGIFRVAKSQVEAVLAGKIPAVSCTAFGREDGLRSAECVGGCQPAGTVTRSGTLWFPTMRGVASIESGAEVGIGKPPRVVLESVAADGTPLDPGRPVRLAPGTESVEFHFTALTFISPRRVRFRYRLDGLDKEWKEVTRRRSADYSRLPPGAYTFRVKASTSDGVWSQQGAKAEVVMEPYFYQTGWFYAIASLSLVLVGYAAYLWRVGELKRRERRLVALVADRTRQLEQANAQLKDQAGRLSAVNTLLEGFSYQDALTGVANRRRLEEVLDSEWRRAIRTGNPLALVVVDIDHFKDFNDAYGHQRGDECLCSVARILSETLSRAGDFIARYGGEEFVAVLAGTDLAAAVAVAEEMRLRVEALGMPHEFAGGRGLVTISLGVAAVVPGGRGTPEELFRAADGALYSAKQRGRNRVEAAKPRAPGRSEPDG